MLSSLSSITRMLTVAELLSGQAEGEGRAAAELARERDLAADQRAQGPADVEAQAGALQRAGGGSPDLLEGREDPLLIAGLDAAAGVDDVEAGHRAGGVGRAH